MWRLGYNTPVHYNDHQLYCGGFSRQWERNKGRCGECGDPWDLPRPRPHEAGGLWGTGTLARVYQQGQVLTATVHLTANHLGWFEFRICPTNDPLRYAKQSCLNKHVLPLLDHPGTRYQIQHSHTGLFRVRLQLPPELSCSQCVLQWHYTTGNNWGRCGRSSRGRNGCGPQEVFRGCSDIAIFPPGDPHILLYHNLTTPADLSQLHLSQEPWPSPHQHTLGDPHNTSLDDLVDPLQGEDEVDLSQLTSHLPTDPPRSNHLVFVGDDSSQGLMAPRPALTFLNNIKFGFVPPKISKDSDGKFLTTPSKVPAPSTKNYVSSDAFRGTLREERLGHVSAPTPFLAQDASGPLVLTPRTLGVTPSPLGPPLILPLPRDPQPSTTPGGIHSVHSLRPPPAYRPLQELQRTPVAQVEVKDGTAGTREETMMEGLEARLGSDRLRLLQRALSLATSARHSDSPPIVLILV